MGVLVRHLIDQGAGGRLEVGHPAPALQRGAGVAVLGERFGDDMGRGGERLVGVAPRRLVRPEHVVGGLIPHRRSGVGLCRHSAHGRGQRLDVHRHRIGAVFRRRPAGGDDHGDGVAHEAHPVIGQREMGGHDQRPGRSRRHRSAAPGQVIGGQHGHHTAGGQRGVGVNRDQPPVGHWAAHEGGFQQVGAVDVVHEPPGTGQQARVLPPGNAGAGEPHGR